MIPIFSIIFLNSQFVIVLFFLKKLASFKSFFFKMNYISIVIFFFIKKDENFLIQTLDLDNQTIKKLKWSDIYRGKTNRLFFFWEDHKLKMKTNFKID